MEKTAPEILSTEFDKIQHCRSETYEKIDQCDKLRVYKFDTCADVFGARPTANSI